MKRKVFKVLVLLVFIPCIIWAAGDKEKTEPITISIVTQPTTVTDGFMAVLDAFEKNTGIIIELEIVPGSSEGVNVIRSRFVADDLPDLLVFNAGSIMLSLDPEKNFIDLSDKPFMDKLDKEYIQTVSSNGKVYGVPVRPANYGGWIYNRRVYDELGLKVPKTWKDLIANSLAIKKAGLTPVIGSLKSTWTSQLVVLADYYNVQNLDPAFTDKYSSNKAKYATSPAALRSFQKLADLYEYDLMNEDYLSTTYDVAQQMLVEGVGVQWPMLSQVLPVIAKNYPDKVKDLGMFPQPSDDESLNGFTVWMPNSFYVPKTSEHIDEVMKLLEYYISNEALNVFMDNQVVDGSFLINGAILPDNLLPACEDLVAYAVEGKIGPALEFLSPVKGSSLQQICVEVAIGILSAEEGAEEADKDVEKQAKQLNLAGW